MNIFEDLDSLRFWESWSWFFTFFLDEGILRLVQKDLTNQTSQTLIYFTLSFSMQDQLAAEFMLINLQKEQENSSSYTNFLNK